MKIKSISALCSKCNNSYETFNFAISAMSNGSAAPILFCQFECSGCGAMSKLERVDSTDFDSSVTRHYGNKD